MEVGPWAIEKLECLRKYLNAYTKILSKQNFNGYFYIDAFAGPGLLRLRKEDTEHSDQQALFELAGQGATDIEKRDYFAGSPKVALEIQPPFTHYVFVELDADRLEDLEQLKSQHEYPDRVFIRSEDCNTYLRDLLQRLDGRWRNWRGVVFLDPFGMQVPWATLEALGATHAVEVFINFPVGMAIQRLLKRNGNFTRNERKKLDAYFGTTDWFGVLYRRSEDLFGQDTAEKVRDAGDTLVQWYLGRLKNAFGYVSSAREVCNTKGVPLYFLIFAGPNKTGAKIASHILKQGNRKVT